MCAGGAGVQSLAPDGDVRSESARASAGQTHGVGAAQGVETGRPAGVALNSRGVSSKWRTAAQYCSQACSAVSRSPWLRSWFRPTAPQLSTGWRPGRCLLRDEELDQGAGVEVDQPHGQGRWSLTRSAMGWRGPEAGCRGSRGYSAAGDDAVGGQPFQGGGGSEAERADDGHAAVSDHDLVAYAPGRGSR